MRQGWLFLLPRTSTVPRALLPHMWIRIVFGTLLLVVVALAGGIRFGVVNIPSHLNPWAPLSLAETPNLLTRYKLARASTDAQACQLALGQTDWHYVAIEDQITRPGCGYTNAVRIHRMNMEVGPAFAVSCRQALSLALWEKHVVQPAALRLLGAPVTKLEHFGSYSCRSVYGRPNARMSHHATADALDVAGFVVGDQRIRVLRDWQDNAAAGQFLREVHDGACQFFDAVYGPEYNAAHRDHFHLDRGTFRTPGMRCRTASSVSGSALTVDRSPPLPAR